MLGQSQPRSNKPKNKVFLPSIRHKWLDFWWLNWSVWTELQFIFLTYSRLDYRQGKMGSWSGVSGGPSSLWFKVNFELYNYPSWTHFTGSSRQKSKNSWWDAPHVVTHGLSPFFRKSAISTGPPSAPHATSTLWWTPWLSTTCLSTSSGSSKLQMPGWVHGICEFKDFMLYIAFKMAV